MYLVSLKTLFFGCCVINPCWLLSMHIFPRKRKNIFPVTRLNIFLFLDRSSDVFFAPEGMPR